MGFNCFVKEIVNALLYGGNKFSCRAESHKIVVCLWPSAGSDNGLEPDVVTRESLPLVFKATLTFVDLLTLNCLKGFMKVILKVHVLVRLPLKTR